MNKGWNTKIPSLQTTEDVKKVMAFLKAYIIKNANEGNPKLAIAEYVTALVIILKNSKYANRISEIDISEIEVPKKIPQFNEEKAWILLLAVKGYLSN